MAGTHYAVLIGNDTFPGETRLAPLKCPLNDVREMASMLRSEKHGPYQVTTLENKSRDIIVQELYRVLVVEAQRDDRVLIFFAGHGRLSGNDGHLYLASENTQLHMLPATSVAVGEIYRYMRESVSRELILILDCCYSGAVEKLFAGALQFRGDEAEQVAANLSAVGGSGSYILTASTGLQRAEERETEGHGLLTKHILQGIREGRADRDDDGLISMHELTSYVQDQVRAEGKQTPLNFTLHEENGGIVIARTGKTACARKLAEVQEKLFRFAMEQRVTVRTLRAVLAVLSPDSSLSAEQKALCHDYVERLHAQRTERLHFLEILEEAPHLAASLRSTESGSGMRALEARCEEAEKRAAEMQSSLDAKSAQMAELVTQSEDAVRERERAREELRALSDQAGQTSAALAAEERQHWTAAERAQAAEDLCEELRKRNAALVDAAKADEGALAEEKRQRATAEAELHRAVEQMQQASARAGELSALVAQLQTAEKEHGETVQAQERNLASSRERMTKLEEQLVQRKFALRDLQEELDALRAPAATAERKQRVEAEHAIRLVLVEDGVSKILATYRTDNVLYLAAQLSSSKLEKARSRAGVAKEMKILAVLDRKNSVYRSMEYCIVFTPGRVYCSTDPGKAVYWDYVSLPDSGSFDKQDTWLMVGNTRIYIDAPSFNSTRLSNLLTELRAHALQYA